MTCYNPLTAFKNEGESKLSFKEYPHTIGQLQIPCGQCRGCRLDKSREWAIRCMHEAKMHEHNCFVTLTYDDKHLPENGFLRKEHPVKFMRRLRKALAREKSKSKLDCHPVEKPNVRFYMAGEYGEQYGRPHYHIGLFGLDFSDKIYLRRTPSGSKLYRSPFLEKLWPYGYSSVGELNLESAGYIARYIMKKLTGDGNKTHYEILDLETGEIKLKPKEYNNMSRKPGIGKTFLEKYKDDIYPEGKVVIKGKKAHTPRYYDKLYADWQPDEHEQMKFGRYLEGLLHYQDQTPERLKVREQVHAAQIKALRRKL